jgi:hypothetical protein
VGYHTWHRVFGARGLEEQVFGIASSDNPRLTTDHRESGSRRSAARRCVASFAISRDPISRNASIVPRRSNLWEQRLPRGVGRALTLRAIERKKVLVERPPAVRAGLRQWRGRGSWPIN